MHDLFAQKAASAYAEAGKRSSKTKIIQHRILPKKEGDPSPTKTPGDTTYINAVTSPRNVFSWR